MTLSIRERSQKVAACIKENEEQGVRGIAAATRLSKSSVHRHQQAINRRNQHPESSFWETTAGNQWLARLVFGLVYHFGIKQGVGAESLSAFIQAVHLDTHVASSASALRQLKAHVNQAIESYQSAQAEHCIPAKEKGICVGADETFFGLPVLVLLELSSGYIFVETECENRTYATWMDQVNNWWQDSPWQCHYLVSDGARALVKLAVSGLGCVSVADLFHALRALGQPMGRAIGQQSAALRKEQSNLRQQLNKCPQQADRSALELLIEHNTAALQQVQQDDQRYHEALEQISQTIHPFVPDSQQWQTQKQLLTNLASPLQCLWNLASTYGAQKAQKALDTFEEQISSFAQGIEAWQQWVTLELDSRTQDPAIRHWVRRSLLPWVYWTQQVDKTRHPSLKRRYQDTASGAFDRLLEADLTLALSDQQREQWIRWAQDFCAKYQRTSSAVEGRNGYLAKLHHARRGFSEQSLGVLTIIHNFDLKRQDGTTAAQRLFGHEFPDLFEWILTQAGDLPMPRRSSNTQQLIPSYVDAVPA